MHFGELKSHSRPRKFVFDRCYAFLGEGENKTTRTFSWISAVNTTDIGPDGNSAGSKQGTHDSRRKVAPVTLQGGRDVLRSAGDESSRNNSVHRKLCIPLRQSFQRHFEVRIHLVRTRRTYHKNISGVHPHTRQPPLRRREHHHQDPHMARTLTMTASRISAISTCGENNYAQNSYGLQKCRLVHTFLTAAASI